MNTFLVYSLITTILTIYSLYSLYLKENQLFVFSIYLVKSKFYFCVLLNFGLMCLFSIGKFVVKVFFGEVRLSEMLQVIEKIRMKFITFLLLFLTFRPTIDISKIVVVVVYHCMAILNMLAFKRSAYIVSIEEKSKKVHIKLLMIYIIVGSLDYAFYSLINIPLYSKDFSSLTSKGLPTNTDSLIYYIFACEFIFLLIKLVSKFLKLIIDITQINMQKHWDLKIIVFNIISFIRYGIKLAIEIKFCVVLVSVGVVPIFFIIDVFYSCWNLVKLGYKFWENYKTNKHINCLNEYVAPELKENEELEFTCTVCLSPVKAGKVLDCGHVFHLRCIKEWVTTKPGCPLCNRPIASDQPQRRPFRNHNIIGEDANIPDDVFVREEIQEGIGHKNDHLKSAAEKISFRPTPEIKKLKNYQKVLNTISWVESSKETNVEDIQAETGGISYSLPCAALYDRSIKNEIKRLEIELYNKKILEIYDQPHLAFSQYEEEVNKLRAKLQQ